jgi:hypothetical protein
LNRLFDFAGLNGKEGAAGAASMRKSGCAWLVEAQRDAASTTPERKIEREKFIGFFLLY